MKIFGTIKHLHWRLSARRAAAKVMSAVLILSSALSPFATPAMAAEAGRADINITHNLDVAPSNSYYMSTANGEPAFCIESNHYGQSGKNVPYYDILGQTTRSGENSESFTWTQEHVTEAALIADYWLSRGISDYTFASTQEMLWIYTVERTAGKDLDGIANSGWKSSYYYSLDQFTVSPEDRRSCIDYVKANKDKYVGRGLAYIKEDGRQGVAQFWLEPLAPLSLKKVSSTQAVTGDNPCYTLEGATYAVFTDAGLTNQVATLTTDASGNSNTVSLARGTYYVKETAPSEGFYKCEETHTVYLGQDGATVTCTEVPYTDPVGMLVGKYDGEHQYNGEGNLPTGSASLAGAEFTVDYYDTFAYADYDALMASGETPTRSWTFRTNANGFAAMDAADFVSGDAFYYDALGTPCVPRGTIVVRETKAPVGYIKSDDVSFQKIMEGSNPDALVTYNTAEVPEQVYRSDFEFTKKAENGSDRLALVPFKVTSLTTGESHIIVTDENGTFASASSWNAHSQNTNGNDWALETQGTIDATRLDASCGTWFGTGTIDDARGALPYDTYSVEELRATSNAGYALVDTTLVVKRDGATIDFGTLDDPEPEIGTTATDVLDGDHYVGVGTVRISDRVAYHHLPAGKTYTLTAELYDAATGEPITISGHPVIAETSFVPEASNGAATVELTLDTYDLAGKTVVVYETLKDATGTTIAEHKDKDDVAQQVTVLVPEIGTTASDAADGDKDVTSEPKATVKDVVHYKGLTPGETYTVTGTLYKKVVSEDGTVGEEKLTAGDVDVTAEATDRKSVV